MEVLPELKRSRNERAAAYIGGRSGAVPNSNRRVEINEHVVYGG